jgi:hypothetical protein
MSVYRIGRCIIRVAMATWYKVVMSRNDAISKGKAMEMQQAFEKPFVQAGPSRKGASLFTKHSLDFEWHYFYFSPQAVSIAPEVVAAFGGVPCEPLTYSEDIRLCVGESGARDKLPRAQESS